MGISIYAAQTPSLLCRRVQIGRLPVRAPDAGWKPAIQQVRNLRYQQRMPSGHARQLKVARNWQKNRLGIKKYCVFVLAFPADGGIVAHVRRSRACSLT